MNKKDKREKKEKEKKQDACHNVISSS